MKQNECQRGSVLSKRQIKIKKKNKKERKKIKNKRAGPAATNGCDADERHRQRR